MFGQPNDRRSHNAEEAGVGVVVIVEVIVDITASKSVVRAATDVSPRAPDQLTHVRAPATWSGRRPDTE